MRDSHSGQYRSDPAYSAVVGGQLERFWGRLVGPLGAGRSAGVVSAAALGTTLVAVHTKRRNGLRAATTMAPVAFDLIGGLITFQLAPTRAKYADAPLRARMMFVGAHLQPLAVPVVGGGSWKRAMARYATAIVATTTLETVLANHPRRRLVANLIAAGVSAADVATDRGPQRWIGPVYLMKVIGGHGGIPRNDADSPHAGASVPSELAARALQTRSLARAPISLYRAGFGWLLGNRMLMLEHTGRRSGQPRFVCLEVVERPAPNRVVVVSGFGERSQWFRNLKAHPGCFVSTGGRNRVPATARMLSEDESSAALRRYQHAHPRAWQHLRGAIEAAVGGPVNHLPMVELNLEKRVV